MTILRKNARATATYADPCTDARKALDRSGVDSPRGIGRGQFVGARVTASRVNLRKIYFYGRRMEPAVAEPKATAAIAFCLDHGLAGPDKTCAPILEFVCCQAARFKPSQVPSRKTA
jgi:hypothetical protein